MAGFDFDLFDIHWLILDSLPLMNQNKSIHQIKNQWSQPGYILKEKLKNGKLMNMAWGWVYHVMNKVPNHAYGILLNLLHFMSI